MSDDQLIRLVTLGLAAVAWAGRDADDVSSEVIATAEVFAAYIDTGAYPS